MNRGTIVSIGTQNGVRTGESAMSLNFVVIGAMKSGTTTIHNLLSQNPCISLPLGKEIPLFNKNAVSKEDFRRMLNTHYRKFEGKCIGKVSPQYMAWEEESSRNLASLFPDVRLIAILRDPIERLLSHYAMCVALNLETRGIEGAVGSAHKIEYGRSYTYTPVNSYVAWSEYGRILRRYLDYFNREQLLVLDFDELCRNPIETYKKILAHIDVADQVWNTDKVGNRKMMSGKKNGRLTLTLEKMGILLLRVLSRLVSERQSMALRLRVIEKKVALYSPKVSLDDLSGPLKEQLRQRFELDAEQLVDMNIEPYWMKGK